MATFITTIKWTDQGEKNIRDTTQRAAAFKATAKKMGLAREKLVVTVDRHGNTSAASVPLALDEYVRAGRIKAGHRVMLQGVGGGFTWGASLVTMT